MEDSDKTREELIDELKALRVRIKEVETSFDRYRNCTEELASFKQALETMQLGVTITDLNGDIIYINPADLEIHGYTLGEVMGRNVRIFAPQQSWKSLTKEEMTSMKRWKRESTNKRKDGSIFAVQLMSDVIKDMDGNPAGVITTCEDITSRKKMEQEIRERMEDLEKFYEASVHREVKMKELKEELRKLQAGPSK